MTRFTKREKMVTRAQTLAIEFELEDEFEFDF